MTDVPLSPVMSDFSQSPVMSDFSQSPVMSDVSQSSVMSDVPQSPVMSDVPQSPVMSDVPQSPVTSDVIQSPVTDGSQSPVTSDVPQSPVTSDVPQFTVMADVPQSTVMADVPQSTVMADVPQSTVMADVPQFGTDFPRSPSLQSETDEISAEEALKIGDEFLRQYYIIKHEAPHYLYLFYHLRSVCVYRECVEEPGQAAQVCCGRLEIRQKILSMELNNCRTRICQVNSHPTLDYHVVVQVCGESFNSMKRMRRFTQIFLLARVSSKHYIILNDIFYYQDQACDEEEEEEEEAGEEAEETTDNTASEQGGEEAEETTDHTASEQGGEEAEETTDHTASEQGGEEAEETTDDTASEQGGEEAEETTDHTASEQGGEEAEETTDHTTSGQGREAEPCVQSIEENPSVSPEQQGEPVCNGVDHDEEGELNPPVEAPEAAEVPTTERDVDPLSADGETVSLERKPEKAEPYSEATTPQQLEQSAEAIKPEQSVEATKPEQATTPDPEITQPPAKCSWASVVKKNLILTPPPSSGRTTTTTTTTTTSSSPDSSSRPQQQRPWAHREGHYRGGAGVHNTSPGYQLFVGNIRHNITHRKLRDFFQRWGKVARVKLFTQNTGSNKPNFGFVDFESADSAQAVLEQRPILFNGDHMLNIQKTRVGEGRSMKPHRNWGRGGTSWGRGGTRGGFSGQGDFHH
ncbi:hypothetical protein ACOMHN_062403 [Nucella lapillus]